MALPVSIGDAILCTQLLINFYKDYRGFPSSHNSLCNRLRTADITLKSLTESITAEDSHTEPTLAGPITQDQASLIRCKSLYDNIRVLLDKYDPSQETSSKSKPVITKAKWAACKQRSIKALLDELENEMGPLEKQKNLSNAQLNQETNAIVRRNMDGNTIFRDPSARNLDFEGVIFTDALDRRMALPFEYCATWEQFYGHLKLSFLSLPGERWVNDGRFEIYDEQNKLALSSEQWNTAIKPGMVISMTMLLHVPSKEHQEGERCPFCQSWCVRFNNKGRNICFECMRWFPVSPAQFIQLGVIKNTMKMRVIKKNLGKDLSIPWRTSGDNDFHDIKALRRFNLIFDMNTLMGERVSQAYYENSRLATRREMNEDLRPTLEYWWHSTTSPSSALISVP